LADGFLALSASLGVGADVPRGKVRASGAGEVAESQTDEQPYLIRIELVARSCWTPRPVRLGRLAMLLSDRFKIWLTQ
jgi:hypothetical protein